jgi:minor curlin subunit
LGLISSVNTLTIGQGGTTSTAANSAKAGQVGGSNSSLIGQIGASNAAGIFQLGILNGSTVLQSAP